MENLWARTLSENEVDLARSFAIISNLISDSHLVCSAYIEKARLLPMYAVAPEFSPRKLLAETIAIKQAILQEIEVINKTIDNLEIMLAQTKG